MCWEQAQSASHSLCPVPTPCHQHSAQSKPWVSMGQHGTAPKHVVSSMARNTAGRPTPSPHTALASLDYKGLVKARFSKAIGKKQLRPVLPHLHLPWDDLCRCGWRRQTLSLSQWPQPKMGTLSIKAGPGRQTEGVGRLMS